MSGMVSELWANWTRRETEEMIDKYYDIPLKEINIKEITDEEFEIIRELPENLEVLLRNIKKGE